MKPQCYLKTLAENPWFAQTIRLSRRMKKKYIGTHAKGKKWEKCEGKTQTEVSRAENECEWMRALHTVFEHETLAKWGY